MAGRRRKAPGEFASCLLGEHFPGAGGGRSREKRLVVAPEPSCPVRGAGSLHGRAPHPSSGERSWSTSAVARPAVAVVDQLAFAHVAGPDAYSRAPGTRSVSQRSLVFQPTIRLERRRARPRARRRPRRCGPRIPPGQRRPPVFAQEGALQGGLAHQPLHPLARHADAPVPQDLVDPRAAIGAARGGVDVDDLRGDRPVLAFAVRRAGLSGHPAVVGGGGDAEDPEDELDRRSMRSSSDSAVVGRSPHSPRSASSCRIQFRNASGGTPSCSARRRITGLGSDSLQALSDHAWKDSELPGNLNCCP